MVLVFAGFFLVLNCQNRLTEFKSKNFSSPPSVLFDFRDLFFDQADRVTTSDELVGAILDSDRSGSYAIELPRLRNASPLLYSKLLMGGTEISDLFLSDFGRELKAALRGRMILDLASGYPDISQATAAISAQFGATHYVGVDHLNIESEIFRDRVPLTGGRLDSYYFRQDILSFLSSFVRPPQGLVIHIAGLEPSNRGQKTRITRNFENLPSTYLSKLLTHLESMMALEDFLVLGPLTIGIYPFKRSFFLRSRVVTPRGQYQIWQKEPPKIWPIPEGELKLVEP